MLIHEDWKMRSGLMGRGLFGTHANNNAVYALTRAHAHAHAHAQGPSKFALDAAMAALGAAVVRSDAGGVEVVGGLLAADVAPLLSLLRHNSSRIQVRTACAPCACAPCAISYRSPCGIL